MNATSFVIPILLGAAMAKPPEPLVEILPRASLIVEAEVSAVISTGDAPPPSDAPPGYTSTGHQVASQVVELKIGRVLKGELPAAAQQSKTLKVTKPVAGYALRTGNKGPFLLEQQKDGWLIIGRYGPDSYRLEVLEQALKSQQ